MNQACKRYDVILDANAYDVVAEDKELLASLEDKQVRDIIRLISTHVEKRQLKDIPPERDIGQSSVARTTPVSTAVFVLGVSSLGEARLGDAYSGHAYQHLQGGNPKNAEDAIIGATAFSDADILVTNDRRFSKRFKALDGSTKVMTTDEFKVFLQNV